MVKEKVANQLKNIPLPDTTVARRISLISKFSLQLDESTDIANEAILLTYVRYFYNNKIHEDILFYSKLETSTTGKNIFDSLVNFFSNNNVDLKNCISITTDGAAAMTGKHVGLIKLVKDIVPSLKWTHCIIHREALASKQMPKILTDVLAQIVKIINYIKSNALNSRLFKILCSEMGSFHESLLLHTEVRWLSRGKCLQRVYELRHEIILFLNSKNSIYKDLFEDSKWIIILAYLADIFNLLNELNLSMQGNFFNIFDQTKKIESFKKKLRIIKARVYSGNIDNLTNVSVFLEEDSSIKFEDIFELVNEHLTNLEKLFNQYFPEDIRDNYKWIEQPFAVDIMTVNMSTDIGNQLIELSCDNKLKQMFNETSLEIFWGRLCTGNYSELATRAISILLIFQRLIYAKRRFLLWQI
ncbi:Ribonuclease H-like domain [Cinara cedri]|uniref:Ribonuclease H-like domain n=1 Tax=Cinara cedri TaxID=506608 RepID=A0A5E4M0Y5_9HEMI|nr:Ribonuclease H-like domain [Cinara cedri]